MFQDSTPGTGFYSEMLPGLEKIAEDEELSASVRVEAYGDAAEIHHIFGNDEKACQYLRKYIELYSILISTEPIKNKTKQEYYNVLDKLLIKTDFLVERGSFQEAYEVYARKFDLVLDAADDYAI